MKKKQKNTAADKEDGPSSRNHTTLCQVLRGGVYAGEGRRGKGVYVLRYKNRCQGKGGKRGRTSSRPLSTRHLASGESRNSLRPRATSSSGSLGERVRFRGNYDNTKRGRGGGDNLSLEIYLFFFPSESLLVSLRFVFFAWTGFSRLRNARVSKKVSSALRARSLARRRVSFYAMLRVERWKTAKRKTSRKRNTKREVGGNC